MSDITIAKGIKGLVGQKMSKEVNFMDNKVKIFKLSVSEVLTIQEQAKLSQEDEEQAGFDVLRTVIRAGVEGGENLSDDEFADFPMDELSKLSNAIMKFSGIEGDQGK